MPAKQHLPENTRLALDPISQMHVLVRRAATARPQRQAPVSLENMNELLMARDVHAFVLAADALGPMYEAGEVPKKRRMGAREAAGSRLLPPNADALLSECYFDPFSQVGDNPGEFDETGRVMRAATRRAASELGLSADSSFIEEGFEYLIEPLHDWMIMRNLMSVAMRLLANARVAAEEGRMGAVLADTGFSYVEPKSRPAKSSMARPSFVIPVGYNPFFSRPMLDLTWNDGAIWPFFCRITEEAKTTLEKLTGARRPRHLVGAPEVVFLTSVQADRTEASLDLKKTAADSGDKWLYMAVVADKGGQETAANALLRAMEGLFGTRELVSCGGAKSDEVKIERKPANLPEALWANIRSHPNRYLMSCRFCGRTVFANMLGGETSFCSPSCRSAYSQMLRKAATE